LRGQDLNLRPSGYEPMSAHSKKARKIMSLSPKPLI
jgi:hypothetical protein